MMLYMNDFDLHMARQRFTRTNCPNRLALVMVVDQLREWSNFWGDGWMSWPPPVSAAKQAMLLIRSTTAAQNRLQETHDISDAEVRRAVAPIKAFLTRMKASPDAREMILRAVS